MLGTPTLLINKRHRPKTLSLTQMRQQASQQIAELSVNNEATLSSSTFVHFIEEGHQTARQPAKQPAETTMSEGATASSLSSMVDEDIAELVDSEDEDIARAIEARLAEYNDVRSEEPKVPCDPAPVLQKYQMEAVSDTATRSTVIVSRRHVLKSAFSALERKTFSMSGTLYVKFSGEIEEDHGGPRREFLRLAMRKLQSSNLFEGPDNSRYFSHNLELLNTNQYHLAGRLMALSLAHNGPGFHCMNPVLYDYIATGNGSMEDFDPSVLPSDISDVMKQLKATETEIDRDRFLSEHGDWFIETAAEITQFTTGLNELNLWNYVKKEPETFKPLFCYAPKPLTKETFFELCQPNLSDVGSNKRADEMDTIYSWELFLQDVEEGTVPVSFEELLAFITGANTVSPCGFSKKLDIQFYSQEGHVRLPFVSTCSLEMWLPRSADPQELSRLIVRALKESQGFLKV